MPARFHLIATHHQPPSYLVGMATDATIPVGRKYLTLPTINPSQNHKLGHIPLNQVNSGAASIEHRARKGKI